MKFDAAFLESLAKYVVSGLAVTNLYGQREQLSWEDYHGFSKHKMDLATILKPISVSFALHLLGEMERQGAEAVQLPEVLQVEIVRVTRDLRHETHSHNESTVYVIGLGPATGFPNATKASIYVEGKWQPFETNMMRLIPEGEVHGFTVEPGGELYFLSVQSPAITRADGHDDYHRVTVE